MPRLSPNINDNFPLKDNYSLSVDVNVSERSSSDTNSCIRIIFNKSLASDSIYVDGYIKIIQSSISLRKMLIGIFTTKSGIVTVPIQIPIIGQTIQDLCNKINSYTFMYAQPINDCGFLSSRYILPSNLYVCTNQWAYLKSSVLDANKQYETDINKNINIYYTSVIPNSIQNNYDQSLGGYFSKNKIYNSSIVSKNIGFNDNIINFSNTDIYGSEYVQIQDEIIKISSWRDLSANVELRGALGTPVRFHPSSSIARSISSNIVFTNIFSDKVQYRCICVRNDSDSEILKDVKMYLGDMIINENEKFEFAIENPNSNYYLGTVFFGGRNFLIDNNLSGLYDKDYYKNCNVNIVSGQNNGQSRTILSFENNGKILLDSALPFDLKLGDKYEIDPSPSQKINSIKESPVVNTNNISDFNKIPNNLNYLSLDFSKNRKNGNDLYPKDLFYVWIKRTNNSNKNDLFLNKMFLNISYNRA